MFWLPTLGPFPNNLCANEGFNAKPNDPPTSVSALFISQEDIYIRLEISDNFIVEYKYL